MKDSVKNAATVAYYHAVQAGYYANTAKDIDSAIAEFEKAVALAPDNTQYAAYLNQLKTAKEKANAPKKSQGNSGKSGGKSGK
jgi:hypothetical protein